MIKFECNKTWSIETDTNQQRNQLTLIDLVIPHSTTSITSITIMDSLDFVKDHESRLLQVLDLLDFN